MFQIDPNTIYTVKDLADVSGYQPSTIYRWFSAGLRHKANGKIKTTTGRAILEYFESETVTENEIDPKLAERLRKAGV